jgi:hypothetical protein
MEKVCEQTFGKKKRKCFGGKIFEEQFLKEFLNKKL